MSGYGRGYTGKTSPHWYDAAAFHELLDASGNRLVRDLVSTLDGCTGATAGEIVATAGLNRAVCKDVTRSQSDKLLRAACAYARKVNPKRLGVVGPDFPTMLLMPLCMAPAPMFRS